MLARVEPGSGGGARVVVQGRAKGSLLITTWGEDVHARAVQKDLRKSIDDAPRARRLAERVSTRPATTVGRCSDEGGGVSVIEVRDLSRTFTVRQRRGRLRREARTVSAVADVRFDIEAGEAVGYIGPNGAGKSTTIKMLTGILVPTGGHLRVAGLDPSRDRTELARRIGVVFGQRTGLWWDLPLGDSFELLRRIYRVPVPTYERNLARFVELLDLGDLLAQPVRQLSLGQRMRGDIVAALLHDPQILYLDEPTIGLDLLSKQRLRGFLRELNAERGTTILLTTHDLVDIEQVCRRVMVIDRGRLLFDGGFAALHEAGRATRTVVVDFAEQVPRVSVPGATVTQVKGARQWLTVPAGAPTGPVVAALASQHEIADLSIREPSIEDVLPHLYAR